MTGIPGTESAGTAPSGATRVLLRIVMLVGLVMCGWLLGTGIGAADETEPGDHPSTRDWVNVAFDHDVHSGPTATAGTPKSIGTPHFGTPKSPGTPHFGTPKSPGTPHFGTPKSPGTPASTATAAPTENPAGTAASTPDRGDGDGGLLTTLAGGGLDTVVPVGEVLRLPSRLPVPDLAGQVAAPLAPVLESALHPVTQVLGTAQQPDRPAPQAAPADLRPVSPAAPVPAPRAPVPTLPPPPVQAPAPVAPTAPSGTAPLDADQLAASSAAVDDPSTSSPVPAGPRATEPLSCPPGSTGANTVLSAGHAATLTDGLVKADPGLVQYRLATRAGGLPRCPSRQPSTSPD